MSDRTKGTRVRFTTAGRYAIELEGVYEGMDDNNRFAVVKLDDGTTRKTRPSTLRDA